MNKNSILILIIVFFINLYILHYINKLQQLSCSCNNKNLMKFIKIFTILTILTIIIIFGIGINPFFNGLIKNNGLINNGLITNGLIKSAISFYSIGCIINIYCIYILTKENPKCLCNKLRGKKILYKYSLFIISIYIIISAIIFFFQLCGKNNILFINKK